MEIEKIEVFRPECNSSFVFVNAIAHLKSDLSHLLPYLNATQTKARYFPKNPYISFLWEDHKVVVEKDQIRINIFEDEKAAQEGVKKMIGLFNEIVDKKDEIIPDNTPYNPPTVMELFKLLPQINSCGKCGHNTCMSFATALASDNAELDSCTEFMGDSQKKENLERLAELLGD